MVQNSVSKEAIFPKFVDEEGRIRPELLDTDARNQAELLAGISTHQVRRFFDEVTRFRTRLDNNEDYRNLQPYIYMLKAKVSYAQTRAAKRDETAFKHLKAFISKSIDQIKAEESIDKQAELFRFFCLFFEAVYGFAKLKSN